MLEVIERKNVVDQFAYTQFLVNNDWSYAGSGCYGVVYTKGDHAIKVGEYDSNTAYLDYIQEVSKINSPWVPKLGQLVIHTSKKCRRRYFALVMEKLAPIKWSPVNNKKVKMLEDATYGINDPEQVSKYLPEIAKQFKQPGVESVLKVIHDLSYRHSLDIHSGNVMIRPGTREYVITDPLS